MAEVAVAAGDVGQRDVAAALVLQLVQAALAAAVAERLPFLGRHFAERLALPEGSLVHRHCAAATAALSIRWRKDPATAPATNPASTCVSFRASRTRKCACTVPPPTMLARSDDPHVWKRVVSKCKDR